MDKVLEKHSLGRYTSADFEPYVGKVFAFRRNDGERVELELLQVSPGCARAGSFRQPFSLLFSLRDKQDLGSGLLRLEHEDFEASDWFVNRVSLLGGDPSIAYCEAVFT